MKSLLFLITFSILYPLQNKNPDYEGTYKIFLNENYRDPLSLENISEADIYLGIFTAKKESPKIYYLFDNKQKVQGILGLNENNKLFLILFSLDEKPTIILNPIGNNQFIGKIQSYLYPLLENKRIVKMIKIN